MSEQLDKLKQHLLPFCREGIVLGFSGGVDSSLLLEVLVQLHTQDPFPFAAIMMRSPFQTKKECEEAEALAKQKNAPFQFIDYDPFAIPEIRTNQKERCYFCKKKFFSIIREFAEENQIKHVIDGTNADDLKVFRPGQRALKELHISSPLADVGFDKQTVRTLSRELGLNTAGKYASPCLATRFDYGMTLTEDGIKSAEAGEAVIRKYIPETSEVRLRIRKGSVRIEVSKEQIPNLQHRGKEVLYELEQKGFRNISIDPEGYRSGAFDSAFLKKNNRRIRI